MGNDGLIVDNNERSPDFLLVSCEPFLEIRLPPLFYSGSDIILTGYTLILDKFFRNMRGRGRHRLEYLMTDKILKSLIKTLLNCTYIRAGKNTPQT